MPEILTESFCERCGTRYTFESAAPKARLGRFKTLSKGLKNFVLDDATSLDEALASARSDETRESTAQQLDAFHKTFNFCMSCRQYTCPNCWNEAEGQCQSCSPMGLSPAWSRGDASAPPAWPTAPTEPAGIEAVAWPSTDRRPAPQEPVPDEVPWPLAALEGRVPIVEPEAEPEPEPAVAAEAEPAFAAEAEPEPVVEEQPVVMAEAEPTIPEAPQTAIQKRAAAAAANTSDLLAKFRPGQSLDDALAAYEASVDEAAPAAQPEPEPVAAAEPEAEPVTWAQPEPVAEPEPEPIAWPEAERAPVPWPEAEPEPVAAMAPEPIAEPEPEPEPVVWAQPEPAQPEDEPVSPWLRPARPAEDIVEVPTWTFTVPETPANGHPSEALSPAARKDRPTPEWPSQPAESFLAARLAARKAGDDMWAASSAEVLGPAAGAGPAAPTGVQACVSCGLSLSATARFCRRCGTRQG
jgi:hypothetical protein